MICSSIRPLIRLFFNRLYIVSYAGNLLFHLWHQHEVLRFSIGVSAHNLMSGVR
jgi:hypothetical protein